MTGENGAEITFTGIDYATEPSQSVYIFIDECDEFTKEDFMLLAKRLKQPQLDFRKLKRRRWRDFGKGVRI